MIILFIGVLIYMTLGYALAQIVRRNDIADTLWGIGFVLLSWGAVYLSGNTSWDMIVLASMVTLWGVRLALHIGSRSWGKGEDFRYHAWRQSWMLRGVWYYRIRAYAQVFLLQVCSCISSQVHFLCMHMCAHRQ